MEKNVVLYEHPDGAWIDFDPNMMMLVVLDEHGSVAEVSIGTIGLRELASRMLEIAVELDAKVGVAP